MISVIIASWKEPITIKKAIRSLKKQMSKEDELFVFCPDKETAKSAESFKGVQVFDDEGKKNFNIKKSKAAALGQAFKKAKGDILVLTDGDVFLDKNALKHILKPFKNNKIGAVSGHPVPTNSRNSMLGFWSHFLTYTADKIRLERMNEDNFIASSGYLFAMRNIIKKMPQSLLSEDAYLSHMIWKKGYKISYSTDAIVNVKFPNNIRDWLNQKVRSTGGYLEIKRLIKNKESMRSLPSEIKGFFEPFKYSKNIKEIFYSIALIFLRIILWLDIYYQVGILKKTHKELWVRVESTK